MLSIAGCGNAQPSTQNATVSEKNDAMATDVPTVEPTVVPEKPTENGILGLYAGDYDNDRKQYTHIVLAWINPETGDTSVWREFFSDDSDVVIDPNYVLADSKTTGKAYLQQGFDSSYERILAKNEADDSWGWVDTTGAYTNVTSLLESSDDYYRAVHGVGFYNGYYYASSLTYPKDLHDRLTDTYKRWVAETNGNSYTSEGQELASQYLELQSQVSAAVQYEMFKIPLDALDINHVETIGIYQSDLIDEPDFHGYTYYIQSDANNELAYVYDAGRLDLTCPVFYNELNGECVTKDRYSDWISAEQCLYSDDTGRVGIFKSLILGDRYLFDTNEDINSRPLYQFENGDIILDSADYEYVCPILNPSKDRFACVVWAVTSNGNGSTSYRVDHPGIYSITGEELSALSSATYVSTSKGDATIRKILDWCE